MKNFLSIQVENTSNCDCCLQVLQQNLPQEYFCGIDDIEIESCDCPEKPRFCNKIFIRGNDGYEDNIILNNIEREFAKNLLNVIKKI